MSKFFVERTILFLLFIYSIVYYTGIMQLYKIGFVEGMMQPNETISFRGTMYSIVAFILLDEFLILLEYRNNEILKELQLFASEMPTLQEVLSCKGVVYFASNVRKFVTKVIKNNKVKTFLEACILISIMILYFEFLFF